MINKKARVGGRELLGKYAEFKAIGFESRLTAIYARRTTAVGSDLRMHHDYVLSAMKRWR